MIRPPILYAGSPCIVAESPRWCDGESALYWVDVTGGRYYRKQDGGAADEFETADPRLGKIGAIVPLGDRRVRLFAEGCRVFECAFGGRPELVSALPGHGARRFNDVLRDGESFFCGVAPEGEAPGELWRLAADGSYTCLEAEVKGMPNGMGVSPDGRTFYFTVSDERRIYAYDYDRAMGGLANRRVLISDFPGEGLPDGMCVDPVDGSLFVALWDGSRLEHRSAGGGFIESVNFPMKKVTSVEKVGSRLFVTTGNKEPDAEGYRRATGAGGVMEVVLS